MEKVKTGLVGCGKVGHLHANALSTLETSDFIAVCDSDVDRATEFADQYGVRAFSSMDEMLAAVHLDSVDICTPHPFHRVPAIKAAEAGVHVLVEKPLASSLEDCDAMLSAADKHGVQIGTMCQRRFYRPSQRVRKAIDEGRIGRPVLGTVSMYGWRDQAYYESDEWRGSWKGEGGGVLVNQAPHQLDLLQWYMGPIDELTGYWGNLNHPYIEVEDTAVALLKFQSGALGNIVVSNSQNPALYGNVHIHGDNGASVGVQTDGGAMFIAGMSTILEPPSLDLWTIPGDDGWEEWNTEDSEFFNSVNPMEHYHKMQIEEFLHAILENREPAITGREGRVTVEIFTAIYRSMKDGRSIRFPVQAEPERGDFDGRFSNGRDNK